MNTIEAEWLKFSADSIVANAPPERIKEIKMAFFAGAWCLMGMQHRLAIEGYSEAGGIAVMGGVYEEMKAYFHRLEQESNTLSDS